MRLKRGEVPKFKWKMNLYDKERRLMKRSQKQEEETRLDEVDKISFHTHSGMKWLLLSHD